MNEPTPTGLPNQAPQSLFVDRSAQEIAIGFYGYWYRLQDLQALQLSGKRIPGGLSGRIELANLHWQLANRELDALVASDPAKARAVQDWLEVSENEVIRHKAQELKAQLDQR